MLLGAHIPQHMVTQGSRQWPQPKRGEKCSVCGGEWEDEKPIGGDLWSRVDSCITQGVGGAAAGRRRRKGIQHYVLKNASHCCWSILVWPSGIAVRECDFPLQRVTMCLVMRQWFCTLNFSPLFPLWLFQHLDHHIIVRVSGTMHIQKCITSWQQAEGLLCSDKRGRWVQNGTHGSRSQAGWP